MKKFNWDDCQDDFRGFNTLQHIIWSKYKAKQLIAEVKCLPESFTEDEKFIAGLYEHFKEEIEAACNQATAEAIIGTPRPSKKALQKTRLEVAIRSTARDFYNEYEELFTQNPNKDIAQIISYTPYWLSFDVTNMDPGRYKTLAECIAHNYSGGDLIASQRPDNDGERPDNFITDSLDPHILYSHYKTEFKRYAARKNIPVPVRYASDKEWQKFANGYFAETVTRVYIKYRKAIMKAPTVSAARALKIYQNSQSAGR